MIQRDWVTEILLKFNFLTHLFLSPGKDVVYILVGDFAVLGREHVTGAVPNHGQHVLFTEFIGGIVY